MLLKLDQLLVRLRLYLEGKCTFAVVRDWVFEYYYAERTQELDQALDEIFPVLLPYLQYEEAEKDSKRDVRIRRLTDLLDGADSLFAERTVFALEFDDICSLTRKRSKGLIAEDTYLRKMAALSPAMYDVDQVVLWAGAHLSASEPLPNKMT